MNLLATFQTPPTEYREVPFWSWNDDLDLGELRRQIGLMDEAGWGGFFMHSRTGLVTPYMGERWMDCIRTAVDEARQRGMGAWLYDEDGWPSGFAGGLSVAPHPEYRAQYLICQVDNRPALAAERVATFVAREVDGELRDFRPAEVPTRLDENERVVQFVPYKMPVSLPWCHGYSYLDLLNPDAVRAFLDSTHEVYHDAVGSDFGRAIPGIFTDEPGLSHHLHEGGVRLLTVPWTGGLAAYFSEHTGYDLLPVLPSLFFDTGDYQAVRFDFWRAVTERFVTSYTRQVYEWCEAHHLASTGHFLAEDTLLWQTHWLGAIMPHHAWMQIPGIDKLARSINQGCGTILTVKQVDSVACQLGRARALCENYGCAGQDFAHTGRKWIGDWAYVLGINLQNPHLALYTMRGERKRDFPQNLFYQQPWWPENRLVADYFARLSAILSQGTRAVDIVVIHPIASTWAQYRPGTPRHWLADRRDFGDRTLDALMRTLLNAQRDFHLADEMLMEPGAPAEARVVADEAGARLIVGRMAYQVVIVPPGVTLMANTVGLLREFTQAGGHVLVMEPRPGLVDGRISTGPVIPADCRVVALDTILQTLDEVLPFDVRVTGPGVIWSHHRRIDDADVYFFVNTDLEAGGQASVELRGGGQLEAWDPATGNVQPLASRQDADVMTVSLDFPPVGSHLLVRHAGGTCTPHVDRPDRLIAEIPVGGPWQLTLDGPNAIILDRAQVRVGSDGGWSQPLPILEAHATIADYGSGAPFALRSVFEASVCPQGPTYLVVEWPNCFEIEINGATVPAAGTGKWWKDISFRTIDISTAVRAGRNEVIVRGVFDSDVELETMYVIGSFGVALARLGHENRYNGQVFDRYGTEFSLVETPAQIRPTERRDGLAVDLTAAGMPFFAGRAILVQEVEIPVLAERAVVSIGNLRAALAHVWLNGERVGAAVWPPHEVDVTQQLRRGRNTLGIELVGTLRNLLGPHHLNKGDLDGTSPESFHDRVRWTDDHILVPFGFDEVTLRLFTAA